MAAVRGRPSGLPGVILPGLRTRAQLPPNLFRSSKVVILFTQIESNLMTNQNPPRRFTPMSQTATDYPVLLIDSDAPLSELHACASERLNAALAYLHLMACSNVSDYAEHDINTVANTARIMVQDVADVFTVMERRGFDSTAVS